MSEKNLICDIWITKFDKNEYKNRAKFLLCFVYVHIKISKINLFNNSLIKMTEIYIMRIKELMIIRNEKR